MNSRTSSNRSLRGLLAAVVAALLLLSFLAVFDRREGGLSCTTLPQVSAEPRDEGAIDAAITETLTSPAEVPAVPPPERTPQRLLGRIVDKRTLQHVPWITVAVQSGATSLRKTTGEDGRFAFEVPSDVDQFQVAVFDGDASYGSKTFDWKSLGASRWIEIPIDIGPTLFVRQIGSQYPSPKDGWQLTLVQSVRPLGSAGEIEVLDEELEIAGEKDRVWSTVSLRFVDDRAFARWPKVEHEPVVELIPRVYLRSQPRFLRGAGSVRGTLGIQDMTDAGVDEFIVLSGRIKTDPEPPKDARVVILPGTSQFVRNKNSTPDFREIEAPGGQFRAELRAGSSYTVVAWAAGFAPRVWMRQTKVRGREQLHDLRLARIGNTSFVMKETPFMEAVDSTDFESRLRARVQDTGIFSRAILLAPHLKERVIHSSELIPTIYRVDSIGIDADPPAFGQAWTQLLPDVFAPQERLEPERAQVHRFEWIDPLLDRPRGDFSVSAGPAGCVVTTKDAGVLPSFKLVPDATAYFTLWKSGCEPLPIVMKDFVEREGERVATFLPKPGWGVLLAFRVADSVEKGQQSDGAHRTDETPATFMEMLAMPPLPSVTVSSIQGGHGTSDEEGVLLVRSRMWPPRLSLRADGYRLRELRRVPGPGSRWFALMEHDR